MSLKSLTLFTTYDRDALSVLRIIGPTKCANLQIVNGIENGNFRLDAIAEGDLVILQRHICQYYSDYQKIISLAHSQNKPIIFDIDDLLFELPENHPDRLSGYYSEALLPMLQAVIEADLVTVATHPLRDYLLTYNSNIAVIPNYLNDSFWTLREIPELLDHNEIITIGYMGGQTHRPDLDMIMPALLTINQKYPGRIRYHFWGIDAPDALRDLSQVDWCPPASYAYEDFAEFFQTQVADIMIAPLCDNFFNACKSAIKYLEYGALGIPGVYSRIAAYENTIANGQDGILAATTDEWVSALSLLIENPSLRLYLAKNAQQKITNSWLLSKNYQRQIKHYRQIIRAKPTARRKSPILSIFPVLSAQYYDLINRQKNKLTETQHSLQETQHSLQETRHLLKEKQEVEQSLNAQLQEHKKTIHMLDTQVIELKGEITGYLLSKSWRFTRPFRKLNQKIQISFKKLKDLISILLHKNWRVTKMLRKLIHKILGEN